MDAVADLDGRHGEALGWAQGICPHPLDGSGGIGENSEVSPRSLKPLKPKQRLVDGEDLSVEDLLVAAEVEAASRPANR